jgi:hypothetical protein
MFDDQIPISYKRLLCFVCQIFRRLFGAACPIPSPCPAWLHWGLMVLDTTKEWKAGVVEWFGHPDSDPDSLTCRVFLAISWHMFNLGYVRMSDCRVWEMVVKIISLGGERIGWFIFIRKWKWPLSQNWKCQHGISQLCGEIKGWI